MDPNKFTPFTIVSPLKKAGARRFLHREIRRKDSETGEGVRLILIKMN